MPDYFREALDKLLEVAKNQERAWAELPGMLERSAANFAIKANAASVSAIKPLAETLSKVEGEVYKQGGLLAALKGETSKLARDASFQQRNLAAVVGKIQTEIEGVKGDVSEMRAELDALRLRVESQQRDLDATIERLDEAEKNWSLNATRSAEAPTATEP